MVVTGIMELQAQTMFHKRYNAAPAFSGSYCVQQTNDGGYIIAGSELNGNQDAILVKTDANGVLTWTMNYNHPSLPTFAVATEARYVIEVDDFPQDGQMDGYVVVGWTADLLAGNQMSDLDIFAMKVDMLGNVLWHRRIGMGNDLDETAYAVIQDTRFGNYVLTGYAELIGGIPGPTEKQVLLMELAQNTGATLFDRAYGAIGTQNYSPDASGYSIDLYDQDANGTIDGYVVTGWIVRNPTANFGALHDVFLMATTFGGIPYFIKRIGVGTGVLTTQPPQVATYEKGYSVHQNAAGDIAIAGEFVGSQSYPSAGGNDAMLIEVRNDGSAVNFMKIYGGSSNDIAYCVRETTNGGVQGYVLGGGTLSFGPPGNNYPTIIRTLANGNYLWGLYYGSAQYAPGDAHSIRPTTDGGFILSGSDVNNGSAWLIKTEALGLDDCLQQLLIPEEDEPDAYITDYGTEVPIDLDNIEPGDVTQTRLLEDVICEARTIKRVPEALHIATPGGNPEVFPNPVHNGGLVTFELVSETLAPSRITASNMQGKVVYSKDFPSVDNNGSLVIDTNGWEAGTYTIAVAIDGQVQTVKLLITH